MLWPGEYLELDRIDGSDWVHSFVDGVDARKREIAHDLNAHLKLAKRYKEDRDLVRLFQAAEGLPETGKYGPVEALRIADYGFCPALPVYWPKKYDKLRYADSILDRAAKLSSIERSYWVSSLEKITGEENALQS